MPDWTKSMEQSYEYYIVDPGTWRDAKPLRSVKSCSISRDSTTDTLGSASLDLTETIGECYVRAYLVTIQNGIKERHPLGTFLFQSPGLNFNGKVSSYTVDGYTPLIELKENPPPIGYSILKNDNIMDVAYQIIRENARAPVVKTNSTETLYYDFVANTSDTWLSFTNDLIVNAKYSLGLDELSRIIFLPNQNIASLQPVWTYDDGNSSILYPEISLDRDLYDIPNVVEVIYSNGKDSYYHRVVNDNENSPVSTINRGREIKKVITDPEVMGEPTGKMLLEYAEQQLEALSTVECTISYTHGYCPVRIGDCVRLNYSRAGLTNIKAKVISQNIKCSSGCSVSEKAVYTTNLWR